jgi:hypothetical protein
MPELVADCPRCGSKKITFDVTQEYPMSKGQQWNGQTEAFCICRHCQKASIALLGVAVNSPAYTTVRSQGIMRIAGTVNHWMTVKSFVSLKDTAAVAAPDHLPDAIGAAFTEGATCHAVGCHNAAAAMFRLCIDLATRPLLPQEATEGLNRRARRDLGLRLPWLFAHGVLPEALRELSHCIKEDGNDGAHAGTLTRADADDLLDFTTALLERMFTEPERLRLAKERRDKRREPPAS